MRKDAGTLAYDVQGGLALDFVARGPATTDKAAMTATCVFSTDAIDRVGDRINISGIRTENHRLNPVVFWNHAKEFTLPIGRTRLDDGTYTVVLSGSEAVQTTRFSQNLLEAEQIFHLIAEGIIGANSIGFRPIKASPLFINGRRAGLDLQEVELLEVSWVGIGCNQEAVRAALAMEHVCGKALSEPLRRSLEPWASSAPIWSLGLDLFAIKSIDGKSPVEKPALGDDAQRLDVMADVIGGLLLKSKSSGQKDWRESDHPRGQPGNAGQFGPGGGGSSKPAASNDGNNNSSSSGKPKPAAKPSRKPAKTSKPSAPRAGSKEAQAAAKASVQKILGGAITPDSHKQLVGHLSALTVPQLHDLRKEHGLTCRGRLKAQIIEKLSHHFNSKIIKEGTVDADKVGNALKPFAKVELDPNTVRFAKADYLAIKEQFGSLTVHRIKQNAVDALTAMKELPAGATKDREHLRQRLAVCGWMVEQAKRDGITGKVEPASMKDAKANLERIGVSERLKGIPWTAFLIKSVREEFSVGDHINDEQIFQNLKDITGPKYTGQKLDAALRRLRADYGSMTQSQLFAVLPKLKKRTDMIRDIANNAKMLFDGLHSRVDSKLSRVGKARNKGLLPMAKSQNDDAENTAVANMPLGAQILRKLHGGLNALVAEVTKMAGVLDACEAKDAIGGLVSGLGTAAGDIEKHWGKFYKDFDIAESEDDDIEDKAADGDGNEDADDDDVDAALAALDDDEDADDDLDGDDLTPEEKRAVEMRIKKLEAELAHEERLERVAATK